MDRLLEGLVLLDQLLHLVERLAKVLIEQVRLLADQPLLGHGRIARKLVHLEHQLQQLPPVRPFVRDAIPLHTQLDALVLDLVGARVMPIAQVRDT